MAAAFRTVQLGNLPADVQRDELIDLLGKYGEITRVDIRHPRGEATSAFVDFVRPEDAARAAQARNGIDFAGRTLEAKLDGGPPGGYPASGASGGGGGGGGGGGAIASSHGASMTRLCLGLGRSR